MKINKKYIFIGLAILIILGVIWVLWSQYEAQSLKPKVTKITTNQYSVGSFTPNKDQLLINFDQDIPNEARRLVKIETEPNFNVQTSWQSSKTLIIQTSDDLALDTSYNIKIAYNNKLVDQTEIRTSPISEQENNQLMQEQAKSEEAFFQAEKSMAATSPWFIKLPIDRGNYVIVYDPEVSQVRISLYYPSDATKEDKVEIKENAIKEMEKELGFKRTETTKYYIKEF